jgi:predicted secreted protein
MDTLGYSGEDMVVEYLAAPIAAVTSNGKNLLRELIDVTTKDSNRWRTTLPAPGLRGVDLPIEGVTTVDNISLLQNWWIKDEDVALTLRDPDNETMTGKWALANLEFSAPTNDKVTFTCSFQSTGEIVYSGETT